MIRCLVETLPSKCLQVIPSSRSLLCFCLFNSTSIIRYLPTHVNEILMYFQAILIIGRHLLPWLSSGPAPSHGRQRGGKGKLYLPPGAASPASIGSQAQKNPDPLGCEVFGLTGQVVCVTLWDYDLTKVASCN